MSALKTIDPMVVFGSFTYFHNFKRHFPDLDEAIDDQPGEASSAMRSSTRWASLSR